MKRLLLLALLLFPLLAGCSPNCDAQSCTQVLFIGNSYTYVNDLPGTFAKLAESGGHPVQTDMLAEGGWALSDHLRSAKTVSKLGEKEWDYVVLQEQSLTPASPSARTQLMYPAARSLVSSIQASGATPIFFLTWAHHDGWPDQGLDYENLQFALNKGYMDVANELNMAVAPVGPAWISAVWENPSLPLWQDDNSHPSEQGTYLTACVFYATIFRESPEGLSYRGNLSKEIAQQLQHIAADIVLKGASHWNLR